MNELDFTPYSSAFPRFLPSLALHPMDETAQSRRAYDCWSQLHFVPPYPWIQVPKLIVPVLWCGHLRLHCVGQARGLHHKN
jgi:hypothetical protein